MNSFINNPYGLAEKYGIHTATFQKEFEELEEQLDQLQSKDFDLMFPQFVSLTLTDLIFNQRDCPHDWILKEGTDNVPCFACGFIRPSQKEELVRFTARKFAIFASSNFLTSLFQKPILFEEVLIIFY